jgi:type 1 fimbria pilin
VNKTVIALAIFIASGISSVPGEASQGSGRVNVGGTIIETACDIALDSREQIIFMDTVPISQIERDGSGISKEFSILLINCTTEKINSSSEWQGFMVTFDGEADNNNFAVNGSASGVALQITDAGGNIAYPGQSLPPGNIVPGDMKLDYKMNLIGNHKNIESGEYFAAIRFKLDYF